MRHGSQIVADKEIAHADGLLQMFELVYDLGADRHIQRRNRLVQHDQPSICRQRPRDRDPLPLPAAELMWEQPRHLPLKPDQFEYFRHALVELLTRGVGKRDAPRNRRLCCDQPLHCFQTFTGGRIGLLGADGLLLQGRVVLL